MAQGFDVRTDSVRDSYNRNQKGGRFWCGRCGLFYSSPYVSKKGLLLCPFHKHSMVLISTMTKESVPKES